MKVIEILRLHKEFLKRLSQNDIKTEDWKDIELFGEYEQLTASGEKTTWVVTYLSEKYGRSERTIHRIISRFKGDVSE